MADKLAPKRRRFATEYLVDLNATQAAIRAGYSKKTAYSQGQWLLKNIEIRKLIDAGIEKREKRVEVKADDVLRELKRLAFADLRKLIDAKGRLVPLSELSDDAAASIASVEMEQLSSGRGKRRRAGDIVKVKLWNKPEALMMLGRHLRLFTDVLELQAGELTDEERAKRIVVLLERARARAKEADRKKGS